MVEIRLSPREQQVIFLIGKYGLSYGEVGSHLGISGRTVETYVSRISSRYASKKRPRETITEIYYKVVRVDPDRDNAD